MNKMRFSILAAAAALLVGVAIGHYAIPGSKIPRVKTAATALSSEANTSPLRFFLRRKIQHRQLNPQANPLLHPPNKLSRALKLRSHVPTPAILM
jgi:hypothetical protein